MSKTFASRRPINVLYEDDHYIAFFKPAGLLSVPADIGNDRTLVDFVNEEFAARPDEPEQGKGMKLHPCHRLDRETSGVILFAKGQTPRDRMIAMFRDREVRKRYVAFVHGRMEHPKGEMASRLKEDIATGDKKCVSITQYVVKRQHKKFTEVDVYPLTGRTNQIRIHFKEIKHPLVGENKFAFRKDFDLKFKRTALHAASLSFTQPFTKERVVIEAELSQDMQNFLERNSR